MFFILSKVLNFLTNPLVIVFVFFLLALFSKSSSRKRKLWLTGLILLLFFSNDFIANEVMSSWEVEPTPYADIRKTYDWGIVLTGVTSNDKMPNDRVYFQHGADRAVHAVELYKKRIIKMIMISGGSGRLMTEGRKEADDLQKAMALMGVPESDIMIENESRNTHESAINVKAMLDAEGEKRYLLITSAFHMRRSEACFRKEGFSVDVFSCDFYTHTRYFTPDVLLIPRAEAIMIWQKLFKEWTGMVAYKIAGYI